MLGIRLEKRKRTWADLLPIAVACGLAVAVGPMIAQGLQANIPIPPGLLHPQPRVAGRELVGRAWRTEGGDQLFFGILRVRLAGVAAPLPGTPASERAHGALETLAKGVELHCIDTGSRTGGVELVQCVDPWRRDMATELVRAGYLRPLALPAALMGHS